jgi:hypothetical protein
MIVALPQGGCYFPGTRRSNAGLVSKAPRPEAVTRLGETYAV